MGGGGEATAVLGTCPCGKHEEQPWLSSGLPWGPLSFISGLLTVVLGGAALGMGLPPVIGLAIFGAVLASIVVLLVIELARGHRGLCWIWRGLWKGTCIVGLPVRIVLSVGAFLSW